MEQGWGGQPICPKDNFCWPPARAVPRGACPPGIATRAELGRMQLTYWPRAHLIDGLIGESEAQRTTRWAMVPGCAPPLPGSSPGGQQHCNVGLHYQVTHRGLRPGQKHYETQVQGWHQGEGGHVSVHVAVLAHHAVAPLYLELPRRSRWRQQWFCTPWAAPWPAWLDGQA